MFLLDILDQAADALGESLPRIGGAIALLIIGLLAAWILGKVTCRVLIAIGVDDIAERYRVHDALGRIGLDRSVSRLLGSIVRIVIALVVIVAAISLLGFAAVSLALNEALLFLPKLFAAIVLVLAGIIVGQFVGEWVARLASQMALGETLGQIARVVIIAVFVMTALTQLGVPTQIMTAAAGILLFAAAISVALALGLGGRDVTRQLSAGRQVRSAFQIGQQITVGDLKGEIISLETAATVLRTSAGQTVRVPHHLLIETVVQID